MISTIGVEIIDRVRIGVSKIGITFTLLIALFLFYEGIPFLNWWPINQAPIVGWLVQGEIDRRLDGAVERAVNREREAWRLALDKAKQERDKIVQDKNREIQTIINKGNIEKNNLEEKFNEEVNLLEEAIKEEKRKSDETGSTNILDGVIPDSVYRNIN